MRVLGAMCAVLAPVMASAAEGASVTFEAAVDFRSLRTFAIAEGRIDSRKPEMDNRLFRQRMSDAIRAELVARGLTEVAGSPDFTVTYWFADGDFSVVERRPAMRVPDIPGQRNQVIPGGPVPVLYTEGTLIIDIFNASDTLIWRGTYRDRETKTPSLSRNLSIDARKLLGRYPPKPRK